MENTVASLQSENTELDIRAFSNLLNDNDQGYKFFWFQCLLDAVVQGKREITFEDLIDHMLAKTWYTVNTYHLKLGPRRYDTPELKRNKLKSIVHDLYGLSSLSAESSEKEILEAIHAYKPISELPRPTHTLRGRSFLLQ